MEFPINDEGVLSLCRELHRIQTKVAERDSLVLFLFPLLFCQLAHHVALSFSCFVLLNLFGKSYFHRHVFGVIQKNGNRVRALENCHLCSKCGQKRITRQAFAERLRLGYLLQKNTRVFVPSFIEVLNEKFVRALARTIPNGWVCCSELIWGRFAFCLSNRSSSPCPEIRFDLWDLWGGRKYI